MNVHEYRYLLADRGTLQQLLQGPSPPSAISRSSLELRLEKVNDRLEAYKEYSPRSIKALLTFKGQPVTGSFGVRADFGSRAVKSFAMAITHVGESQNVRLPASVRPSGRKPYELMITRTTRGSFGFELEPATLQPELPGVDTPVELALRRFRNILEASLHSEDNLTEAIGEVDRRALNAICAFLKTVAAGKAICAFEMHQERTEFKTTEEVNLSEERLRSKNIQEEELELVGRFQGFLPNSRRAEIQLEPNYNNEIEEEMLSAHVDPKVDVEINNKLNRLVKIRARSRREGKRAPSFTVLGWEEMVVDTYGI